MFMYHRFLTLELEGRSLVISSKTPSPPPATVSLLHVERGDIMDSLVPPPFVC